MITEANYTAWSLREAADKLDEVWKSCKIAHVSGISAQIVGGILTAAGGIVTVFTLRAGARVMMAGIAVGVAGAGTKVGTSFTEACINSTKMKKAKKDLKEIFDCRNEVRKTVHLWLDREEKKMSYLQFLAERTLNLNDPVVKIIHSFILLALSEDAKMKAAFLARQKFMYSQAAAHAAAGITAGALFKAIWERAVSKLRVMLMTGNGFVLHEILDLGFTIIDLVQNKGSEAAKNLREIADGLENQSLLLAR